MSEVLERVREKYPEYKDIPEDELTLRIGTKYPAYLERDEKFKSEFQGVVTDRALKSAQAGTLDLIGILGNPAAGEAAQEGREQSQAERSQSFIRKPRGPLLTPGSPTSTTYGGPPKPLATMSETLAEPSEAMTEPRITLPKATIRPTDNPAMAVGKEVYNIAAGIPEFLSSNLGLLSIETGATAPVATAGAFTADMLMSLGRQIKATYKNWDKMDRNQKIAAVTDIAGTGTFAALLGHGTYRGIKPKVKPEDVALQQAAKVAEPVAPMTAAAVQTQPAILETAKPVGETLPEPPKTSQEPLRGIQTPSAPESPAVPPAALEATPSEQITGASYTHPETGEVTTGQNHIEAAKAQGVEAPKVPTQRHGEEYGYEVQDPKTGATRYVSRDEAEDLARKSGQLLNEPEFGKLHSNEIWHAIPFEKRQRLKQMSLSDTDIASIESGKERVEDVVQRKFPEISEETKGLIESEITGVLEEKGKPNAIHPESAQLLRTVRDEPGEGEQKVPAEEAGKKDDEGGGQVSQKASGITGPDLSEGETEPDIEPTSAKIEAPPVSDAPPETGVAPAGVSKAKNKVKKAALTQGQKAAKGIKSELIRQVEEAIKGSPPKAEYEGGVHGFVEIDIPGDGSFKVPRNIEALSEMRDKLKRISTSSGTPPKAPTVSEKTTVQEDAERAAKAYGSPEAAYKSARNQLRALESQEPPARSEDREEWNKQIQGADALIDALYHKTTAGILDAQAEAARDRVGTYKVGAEGFESEIARLEKIKRKTEAHKERLDDLRERYKQNQEFIATNEANADRLEQEAANEKTKLGTSEDDERVAEETTGERPETVDAIAEAKNTFGEQAIRDGLQTYMENYGGEPKDQGSKGVHLAQFAKKLVAGDARALESLPKKEGATAEPAGAPPEAVQQRGKVRLKGTGPQTYSVVEHLPATEIEISNGEQPVRVKNDKTGAESVVLESQLQEVQERTAEQREASKGMTRKELDDELRRVGLDPSSFGNSKEKRAALKRAKAKGYTGPGAMGAQDPFDPAQKAQIEQLTEAMKGLQGRKVSLREKIKESFNIGDRVSAAKDAASRAITALKNSGDYVINQWRGKQLDEMLREKGVLSGELEKRGWRAKQFAKQVLEDIPDKAERAAIGKWIDAGGSQQELLWGANHTKPEYRQAYIDAIHLSGDKLVAARQIQSYFDARLQEAIDAGVLQDGIEDYIHRIFEKDPEAAQRMNGYVQSGILSRNPALTKKRIFQMDWEAERLGYKVVQDFVPRIVDYESSLARAIAARAFIRKMVGFTDKDGVKHKGMLAPDGRPVIDVAGMGTPIEGKDAQGQPTGIIEGHLINPSFKPGDDRNPLNDRTDYKERPEYSALKKWKWATEDAAGKPIYVQGNVLIHKDFVGRIDALLKPSSVRYAESPKVRSVARAALTASSTVKQTMLDFSGFHQVQEVAHGLEHGILPWKIINDIDFMDPNVDALMKGGVTLGGEYRMAQAEGLVGRSLSNLIPGVSTLMKTYHSYLFQDFIPRLKMSMALQAFERNKARFASELSSGQMTMDDVAFRTASEANAAFGGLNYTMLERSKTEQDIARLILLAPDFLEARIKFVAQAFKRGGGDMKTAAYWKKGGPLTSNEQRKALLLGAAVMYSVARIANQLISGHPHFEPENAFSVVINGKAYGLRTVQGDVLHLFEQPIQFWMSRLNPVFGRTLLEAGTGRDYFGRKRSVPEQLWDAAATVAPVSLRFGRERSIWESLANGMGITARRYNDADQAFKLAQKWKDKNGIQSKGEFVYDSDKDPLRPLKLALANGDEAGAVKELKKLKSGKSKYNTDFALNTYFNHYATMRFTGSEENDRKFIASLSADEKKTVEAAKQAKMGMRELYFKANAKTVPQKVEPDRSGVDVPIPQFPQRIE